MRYRLLDRVSTPGMRNTRPPNRSFAQDIREFHNVLSMFSKQLEAYGKEWEIFQYFHPIPYVVGVGGAFRYNFFRKRCFAKYQPFHCPYIGLQCMVSQKKPLIAKFSHVYLVTR